MLLGWLQSLDAFLPLQQKLLTLLRMPVNVVLEGKESGSSPVLGVLITKSPTYSRSETLSPN